ncbi:MAG TPA: OadG family transporter subunit, partial [Halomonas sp.]|nr:OadG family transporter subunit [Halomonas sp.]
MQDSQLLQEGLSLMGLGMGFVFVFLTLLVIVTTLMSKAIGR